MAIKVSQFVKAVPEAAKAHLPRNLQKFRVFLMPWLSQVYYDDKLIHYELVKLPSRYGENKLEIGYHFESRTPDVNNTLLAHFDRHLFEIRDQLGEEWWAERWDRGWTKIYTVFEFQSMDDELVESTAQRLAEVITVLQPIYLKR